LVATSLAFETTGCSILPLDPDAAFLVATGADGDAFFVVVAATVVDCRAVVAAFFAAGLTAGFALVVDVAGFFAVFAAPEPAALGTFAFTAVLLDFTALFVGDFFAAGLAADFFAGFSDSVNALTAFFAKVFTTDLTAGREAFFATAFEAGFATGLAGFTRDVVLAIFFVLLADFATVAFMVPCPLTNLPTPRSVVPPCD
jgi:hypothetical protein